ncbi:MAG: hypothetical protein ACT4PM_03070 [Gemmatimonadales bacterium]
MNGRLVVAGIFLGACASAAADHERLGDHAYREGRFLTAVAEYRAALKSGGGAAVWAKLGSAALRERHFGTAIEAYTALGQADPSRIAEALVGLERVAQLAERGGPAEAGYVAAAVKAIRTAGPGRPLGRWLLKPGTDLALPEALAALPAALAAAPGGRVVDSLLIRYGEAQRVTTACEGASRTYRIVLRRTQAASLRAAASAGLGACALQLGLDALAASRAEEAESWFESVTRTLPQSPLAWRAELGFGDARLLQGDVLGAALSYQSVLSAKAVPDSLRTLARDKLNRLGNASVPPASGSAG